MIIKIFRLGAVEGLITLLVLAFLPSDPENRIFWLYSAPRLLMMFAAISISLVCYLLASRSRSSTSFAERLTCLGKHPLMVVGSWLAAILTTAVIILALLPLPSNSFLTIIRRSLPLIIWSAVFAWQLIYLLRQIRAPGLPIIWQQFISGIEYGVERAAGLLVTRWLVLIGILAAGFLLLTSIARNNPYPTGYAGLFAWMSELIACNHFALPRAVPFYGPGGIPFAYPPAGLYLMAFFTSVFRVPAWDYLRFAPAVISIMALAPYFAAVADIEKDSGSGQRATLIGAVAALLLISSPRLYMAQGEAAGIVRALGFLFSMASVYCAMRFLRQPEWEIGILAAVCLALTLMTHLNYFVFTGVMFGALVLSRYRPFWQGLGGLAAIAAGGLILSSPWWLTVISRDGLAVFQNAMFSHGNFSYTPGRLLGHILTDTLGPHYRTPFLAGGLVIGFFYQIARKRWFHPVAIVGVLVFSLGDWMLSPFAAAMCAEILVDLARWMIVPQKRLLPALVFIILTTGMAILDGYRQITPIHPVIDEETLSCASWVANNTPTDGEMLFLTSSADEAEWMPWLAQHSPSVGSWGAEWKGNFLPELGKLNDVASCASNASINCASQLIGRFHPDIVVSSKNFSAPDLDAALASQSGWIKIYENDGYCVWGKNESN